MNLVKLFDTQRKTAEMYEAKHPTQPGEDRFSKKILALLVEVGECANEWRGFKYWSKDQKPRLAEYCVLTDEIVKRPLLEEYVDGLHFVLELGIDLAYTCDPYQRIKEKDVVEQFKQIYKYAIKINRNAFDEYEYLVSYYLGLGEMLGFTWEEIEAAYFSKNQVNHERQDNGY